MHGTSSVPYSNGYRKTFIEQYFSSGETSDMECQRLMMFYAISFIKNIQGTNPFWETPKQVIQIFDLIIKVNRFITKCCTYFLLVSTI